MNPLAFIVAAIIAGNKAGKWMTELLDIAAKTTGK
jgi:hypothetical protein